MGIEEGEDMKNIKIGGIVYEVDMKDLEKPHAGATQLGWCKYDEAKIEVNNTINHQKQDQTLIHEMTHAIFHESGLDEYADDENIVTQFALVLFQVLKENSFDWLRD